jgi:hypothetical protein
MIDGNRRIRRLSVGFLSVAAGVAVTGAAWVNPAPPSAVGPPPAAASPPLPAAPAPAAAAGLAVAAWRLVPQPNAGGPAPAVAARGRPVTLSMILTGGEAAVERLRREGRLRIQVHWQNQSGAGAPDLVTDLTIGDAGLAPVLEAQIRRKGFFEWHSWARKDTLSPGSWTVSVTRPDGQPLPCGGSSAPCRFSFDVG